MSKLFLAVPLLLVCSAWLVTMPRADASVVTGDDAQAAERALIIQVTDAAGDPIADADVEALSKDRSLAVARTDGDGHARLFIAPGVVVRWIVALKPGAGLDYFEGLPWGVPAAELRSSLWLKLDGARTVRILALDSQDEPVPRVRFAPWIISKQGKRTSVNLSGSFIAGVSSDARGVAAFDWIPRDTWRDPGTTFLVQSHGYHWPAPPEDVYPGHDDVDVVARLLRATSISGKVKLSDGRPAAGALVQAEGRGDTINVCRARARTALDGSYTLAVAPGQSYTLTVAGDEGTATRAGVIVRAGAPVGDADLELARGVLIHGTMTRADGTPVSNELVVLGLATGEPDGGVDAADAYWGRFAPLTLQRWTYTDDEGHYAFRVGSGDYRICAMGATPGNIHEPHPITVPDEPRADVRIDFTRDSAQPVFGTTAAPFKTMPNEVYEYAFHPAWTAGGTDKNRACLQCHRPHRDAAKMHGGR